MNSIVNINNGCNRHDYVELWRGLFVAKNLKEIQQRSLSLSHTRESALALLYRSGALKRVSYWGSAAPPNPQHETIGSIRMTDAVAQISAAGSV